MNEPEFLVVVGVVFVLIARLRGDYGRRFSAFLVVQMPVVVLYGAFLVALLAALLVKSQRETLAEFLQHALLLALRAMRSILIPAGGHIGDIRDGRRFLQPRMADQRNRRLRQRMLGRNVAHSHAFIFLVTGPVTAVKSKHFPYFSRLFFRQ